MKIVKCANPDCGKTTEYGGREWFVEWGVRKIGGGIIDVCSTKCARALRQYLKEVKEKNNKQLRLF